MNDAATMYIVFLRFSRNRAEASAHLAGHEAWIARGVRDGFFLVVGSLEPMLGGAVIAHGLTREALDAKIAEDPFVTHDVVAAEVVELSPRMTDARLAFLLA